MLKSLLKNIDAFNTLYENEIKTLNHQIDKFIKIFEIFKLNHRTLVKEVLPNKLFKKIKIDEHGLVITITDEQAVKFVFDQSNINIIQDDFEMIEFIIKHFNRFNNDAEIIIAKQSEKVKKELLVLTQMILTNEA